MPHQAAVAAFHAVTPFIVGGRGGLCLMGFVAAMGLWCNGKAMDKPDYSVALVTFSPE
jgi:hypothetical protein